MPIVLPRSLDKNVHTVDEEVAFAKSLTPEERLVLVSRVCRALDFDAFTVASKLAPTFAAGSSR